MLATRLQWRRALYQECDSKLFTLVKVSVLHASYADFTIVSSRWFSKVKGITWDDAIALTLGSLPCIQLGLDSVYELMSVVKKPIEK